MHSPWAKPLRLLCPWDFSRQECWSGLSFPTPGYLSNLGTEPMPLASHALASRSSPLHHLESLRCSAWTSGKISRASRVLGVSFPHHFAPIDEVPPPPPNSLLQGGRCKSCLSLSRRFLLGAPESLHMVIATMKLKDSLKLNYSLEKSYNQPRQHIKNQNH